MYKRLLFGFICAFIVLAGVWHTAVAGEFYIVKPGDTLSKIALAHNTTVAELARLNHIRNPNLIYAGQRLIIPGLEPTGPTGPGPTTPDPTPTGTPGPQPADLEPVADGVALLFTTAAGESQGQHIQVDKACVYATLEDVRQDLSGGTACADADSGALPLTGGEFVQLALIQGDENSLVYDPALVPLPESSSRLFWYVYTLAAADLTAPNDAPALHMEAAPGEAVSIALPFEENAPDDLEEVLSVLEDELNIQEDQVVRVVLTDPDEAGGHRTLLIIDASIEDDTTSPGPGGRLKNWCAGPTTSGLFICSFFN